MADKILLVDDDTNILEAYKRQLRKKFEVEVADNGEKGLELISQKGPFAVVVADMQMPVMDGIKFLARVKEQAPETVRMMLTGNADLQTAMNAVNKGNIFRFLTKPCKPEILALLLKAGIKQYHLVNAERELLEDTLRGSVKVLTEILSLVNPAAFSRSSRIVPYVKYIASELQLPKQWQFELAAMLSQIGCVSLPAEIFFKVFNKQQLTEEEQEMWNNHPSLSGKLLLSIPRLESVTGMVEQQQKDYQEYAQVEEPGEKESLIDLGAQILKTVLDYDQLIHNGFSNKIALSTLGKQPTVYNPEIVKILGNFRSRKTGKESKLFGVNELIIGMQIDQDIMSKNGLLLVAKGQEVTLPVLERLRNYSQGVGVIEPICVQGSS